MNASPEPVEPEVVERVRAAKAARRASGFVYEERPRLAFIVHSFNRISNIDQIVDGLRAAGAHELIVCDDGSVDGSRVRWLEHLDRPNDFLIHSNDLHEIRVTDRAISWARSEIVCLVQDDDVIPDEPSWVQTALDHFSADPTLAIIGGFMGFQSFDPDPAVAVPFWGRDEFATCTMSTSGRTSSAARLSSNSAAGTTRSQPPVIRASASRANCACAAWTNGYRVGYSFVPLKGAAGHYAMDGGTMLFAPHERERNRLANSSRIFERYASRTAEIDALVEHANLRRPQS